MGIKKTRKSLVRYSFLGKEYLKQKGGTHKFKKKKSPDYNLAVNRSFNPV